MKYGSAIWPRFAMPAYADASSSSVTSKDAERERRIRGERLLDAEAARRVDHRLAGDELLQLGRRRVERVLERVAQRDQTLEDAGSS